MVSAVEQYTIDTYRPEDEPQVLALLQDSLGEGVSQWEDGRLWRWKHFQNPFAPSYIVVARGPSGQVLGVRALMRWDFVAGERRYRAIRPVDTATRADCRGQGIFPALTRRGMADARDQGIDFLFNTPNEMSRPGYLKMGWSLLTEAYPGYRVVDWVGFGASAARGLLARTLKLGEGPGDRPVPEEFSARHLAKAGERLRRTLQGEREWQGRDGLLRVDRTAEYLVWRYGEDPVQDHWVVWSDPASPVDGCCVVRPVTTGLGPRSAVIEEIVLARPDEAQLRCLLGQVREAFGAHFLQSYFTPASFYGSALARLGFRPARRNGMSVVVNPLGDTPGLDLSRLAGWGLGLGELELF